MPETGDDQETERLIQLAGQGDRDAVERLFSRHRQYLRRLIDVRLDAELRRRIDPSDVIQETQMVASQRLDEFVQHRPASFRLWLRRKALDLLIDLRRKHVLAEKRSVRREVAIHDHSSVALANLFFGDKPSARLRGHELAEQIQTAVSRLEEVDREMLLLRHAEELTNAEVAALLEIEGKAASKRYGRALGRLRQELIRMGVFSDSEIRG